MTPNVKKFLLALVGCALAAAPELIPALSPFASLLLALGSALGGGALIPRPGDAKAGK